MFVDPSFSWVERFRLAWDFYIDFSTFLLLFLGIYFITRYRSNSKWKGVSQGVLDSFRKRGGRYHFLCHPMHHGSISRWACCCWIYSRDVGELRRLLSIESPDRSGETVASITGVDLIVNFQFRFPSVRRPARFSPRAWFGWICTYNNAFSSFGGFWLLVFTIPPEIFIPFLLRDFSVLSTKGSLFCFFGIDFLELWLSLGILNLSRLILIYRLLLLTNLIRLQPLSLSDNW